MVAVFPPARAAANGDHANVRADIHDALLRSPHSMSLNGPDTMPSPTTPMPFVGARKHVSILGVTLTDLAFHEAVARLSALARDGSSKSVVYFANAHTLELARRDPAYRDCLNSADLVLADGTGVRWAAQLQGVRLSANLNGTDLIPAVLAACNGDGLRLFLLGSTPEGVARTARVIGTRFPGWNLVGAHPGFLDERSTGKVIEAIARARPHLLLVAMGNPLQEFWVAAQQHRLPVPLVACVGGLFNYLNGDYRRAPAWMRRRGLEWLAVLVWQRWKWHRYLVEAPRFLIAVAAERLRGGRP